MSATGSSATRLEATKPPLARRPSWVAKPLLAALAGVLISASLAATPANAGIAHQNGGSLVLVGGGLSDGNATIYNDIVRLAGGANARIGIVTAASSVPSEDPDAGTPDCNNSVCNGAYYSALFEKYGAHAEYIPIDLDHISAADDPAVVAQINGLTGFFFGGGDQYRYVTTMKRDGGRRDSAALAAIRARLLAGAVVSGSSAGAQIQAGRDMLTGGESYEGLRDGSAVGYFDDATKLGYLPEGGFGFFQDGLLDTHFSTRGRLGRSVRLAADTRHARVFGLDQDTALEVTGVGTRNESLRVLGTAGVHVLDLRQARTQGSTISDVRWTRLSAGDSYDANRWQLHTPKPTFTGTASTCQTTPTAKVFGKEVLGNLGVQLAGQKDCRSAAGVTAESNPAFMVTVSRDRCFTAYQSGQGTSYVGLNVRINKA